MVNRERGNVLIIIIGIFLIICIIGFFRSDSGFWGTVSYKQLLRLPCGLTVEEPGNNSKATFPLKVDGYINGCGWAAYGAKAGTVQAFDGHGTPVTRPIELVINEDSRVLPLYFEAELTLVTPPQTDTGNIVFTSTTGLLSTLSVRF